MQSRSNVDLKLKEQQRRKANYGIDAPPIIMMFGVFALLFSMLAFASNYYLQNIYPTISYIVTAVCFFIGVYCLSNSVLMILSSRSGKVKVIKNLVESLQLTGGEKVLDVGCGRGMLLIEVAKYLTKGKAVGIDIWKQADQSNNSKSVTEQNTKFEDVNHVVEILTCNMTNILFPDETFDCIVSSLAIHNVKDKTEREKALKEIARVLKPGGQLALLDFQKTNEYTQMFNSMGWEVKETKRDFRMFPPARVVYGVKPSVNIV